MLFVNIRKFIYRSYKQNWLQNETSIFVILFIGNTQNLLQNDDYFIYFIHSVKKATKNNVFWKNSKIIPNIYIRRWWFDCYKFNILSILSLVLLWNKSFHGGRRQNRQYATKEGQDLLVIVNFLILWFYGQRGGDRHFIKKGHSLSLCIRKEGGFAVCWLLASSIPFLGW